jgi:hypothetical protein
MPPWHSIDEEVHHDNGECRQGGAVTPERIRQGSAGKPKCAECARIGKRKSFKTTRTDP